MANIKRLLNLSANEKEEISELFSGRMPFGPNSAHHFKEYPEIQDLVFSTENEIWKEYQTHPRMIIGRKGSGKTSVLAKTTHLKNFRLVHKVSTSELIEEVRKKIYDGNADLRKVPAEESAKVWRRAISVALMGRAIDEFSNHDFPLITKYFFKIGEETGSVIRDRLSALKNSTPGSSDTIIGFLVNLGLRFATNLDVDYEDAIEELDLFLRENKIRTVVLVDSIEEYHLEDIQTECILKGLLRCVGAYGNRYRQIRMSIPAEAYFDLRSISSNIMKDFHDSMVLHWSPIELLRMIAWRYLIGLSVADPDRLQNLKEIDFSDRNDVHQILDEFLPNRVVNRGGYEEFTIAYLLRHTQLLPRQLITLLNSAFSRHRPNVPREEGNSRNAIVNAIEDLEETICQEIFAAYRFKFPFAERLCAEVIPYLPRFFDEQKLQEIYRRKGRLILQEHSQTIQPDFRSFRTSLFEIGAIGRVTNRDKLYADAEFEYAMPGRLVASDTDELCLHPVFSGAYETNSNRNSKHYVYPHMNLYDSKEARDLRP